MGILEIQHLVKRFGQRVVLDDLNLTVADGEFFVLLGPSGGGKSTILKLVCGIEAADGGRIVLAGRDLTPLPPRERNIGMVFQDYGLYPHMHAYANIAYGLEARGMAKDEIDRRVREAAGKLGLTPLLERVIVDLSGGEQQRVALARALAKAADLYLFDEPLSNLDPKLRAQARRDIQMVHRAKGRPTLYVTHDQTEALAIGDRIGIIAHGRLQQVGTAEQLLHRPANLFVASFLGAPAMNVVKGRLRFDAARDGLMAQLGAGLELALPAHWKVALGAAALDSVFVGVPPAALLPAQPGAETLTAVIEDVEPLVGEAVVTLMLGGAVRMAAVFPDRDDAPWAAGETVAVGVDAEQICLFDPTTERALGVA